MSASNYIKWWKLMNAPLMSISIRDLEWGAKQPYNSFNSKKYFLAEIERRKNG